MAVVGLGMVLVFGFLTFRNFQSGRMFWSLATGLGVLLGAANIFIEYDRSSNPRTQVAQSSGYSTKSGPDDPWSDAALHDQSADDDADEEWSDEGADEDSDEGWADDSSVDPWAADS